MSPPKRCEAAATLGVGEGSEGARPAAATSSSPFCRSRAGCGGASVSSKGGPVAVGAGAGAPPSRRGSPELSGDAEPIRAAPALRSPTAAVAAAGPRSDSSRGGESGSAESSNDRSSCMSCRLWGPPAAVAVARGCGASREAACGRGGRVEASTGPAAVSRLLRGAALGSDSSDPAAASDRTAVAGGAGAATRGGPYGAGAGAAAAAAASRPLASAQGALGTRSGTLAALVCGAGFKRRVRVACMGAGLNAAAAAAGTAAATPRAAPLLLLGSLS